MRFLDKINAVMVAAFVAIAASLAPSLALAQGFALPDGTNQLGHQISAPAPGKTPPVVSACGTGPAIVGDDKDGTVTMGTTATGCVITFATTYATAPNCTVIWQATPLASQSYTVTATAITTVQTSTSSNKLNYHCAANVGG